MSSATVKFIYVQEPGKWCVGKGGHRDYKLRIDLEYGKMFPWALCTEGCFQADCVGFGAGGVEERSRSQQEADSPAWLEGFILPLRACCLISKEG